MTNKIQIEVENKLISIVKQDEQDYICLTDMVRDEEGTDHIRNWMRNRNTVEFIGLWETLNNPNFKHVEFDTFRKQAGLNSFNLTPKKWIEATNAIGLISKSGRYGGTYAHKDLAFEFGLWISPMFKLLLIKEYQRLKEIESNQYNLEWNVKRILTKTNYLIHTDAVRDCILPEKNYDKDKDRSRSNQNEDSIACIYGFNQIGRKTINYELNRQIDGDILMFYIGPYKDFNSKPTTFNF